MTQESANYSDAPFSLAHCGMTNENYVHRFFRTEMVRADSAAARRFQSCRNG